MRSGIVFPERQGRQMGRVEKRMYRRAQGQKVLRRLLVLGIAGAVVLGLWLRQRGGAGMDMEAVALPTPTPVAARFDETVEKRQVALDAVTWYAIQTGIYSSKEAAEAERDLYAQRGAPGYVKQDGGKWRVIIACYGDKEDASAVRERLRLYQSVESYLYEWSCPDITLRLTGMAGQLDVAEAGLSLLGQAAAVLRDQAAALDAGEIDVKEARGSIEGLTGQIDLWRKTAEDRFVKPYPALVEMELQQAAGWGDQARLLNRQESATALSAQMKLTAMALFDQCCGLRNTLMQ